MKQIILFASLVGIFCACKNEMQDPITSDEAVSISAQIALSKASGTTWNTNDSVGVYMLNAGTYTPIGLNANVPYLTPNADGNFVAQNAVIYYPQSGKVGFLAYYPYQKGVTGFIYKVRVADQTKLAAIDLMLASKLDSIAKTKAKLTFNFKHKLSDVCLNISSGAGVSDADLVGLSVSIQHVPTTADFNLSTEVLSAKSDSLEVQFKTSANGKSSEAILIPGRIGGKRLVFTMGGSGALAGLKFEYVFPLSEQLNASQKHSYNVKLNRTGVLLEGSVILPWTDSGTQNIDGNEQFPVNLPD